MKFEYKVESRLGNLDTHQKYLNDLGKSGWDLISVSPRDKTGAKNYFTFIFKRPIQDAKQDH